MVFRLVSERGTIIARVVREDFLEVVACEGALTHVKEALQSVV